MQKELGKKVDIQEVKENLRKHISVLFAMNIKNQKI
jgi:hypothetical protein